MIVVETMKPAHSPMARRPWWNSRFSNASGTEAMPSSSAPSASTRNTGVARGACIALAKCGASAMTTAHTTALEAIASVTAVRATARRSPGHRTSATDTPRSFMLTSAFRATSATANTPNSFGAMRWASTIVDSGLTKRPAIVESALQRTPARTWSPSRSRVGSVVLLTRRRSLCRGDWFGARPTIAPIRAH